MKKIVLATKNKNKVIEINEILKGLDIQVVNVQGEFNPVESGSTFAENAYIKAFEAAKLTNLPALADDSGLVVDAIGGRPGIYSARYADNTQKRNERVLNELKDVPNDKRTARFVCAMVMVDPAGNTLHSCEGTCDGVIINEHRGTNGFGYDPIFFMPELNKTMAELSLDEKNQYSHRSKALKCIVEWLKSN